jgi:hypothetical protein
VYCIAAAVERPLPNRGGGQALQFQSGGVR